MLEDKPGDGAVTFCAEEVKKANAELKAIAADVKSTMQIGFAQTNRKLDECKGSIAVVGAKIDAVDKKVAKLRKNGKPRGRYTKEARALCWNFWETAANHEEVWRSVNTRVTYEAVFNHYKVQLARVGVERAKVYEKIIHAEDRRRNRELQARQDEARQKSAAQSNTGRGKNCIMRDVKNHAKSALALTLAIAGGIAAGMRPAAVEISQSRQTWQINS